MSQLEIRTEQTRSSLSVEPYELLIDHRLVRRLLDRFSVTDSSRERTELLNLATDLFRIHASIEAELFSSEAPLRRVGEDVQQELNRLRREEARRQGAGAPIDTLRELIMESQQHEQTSMIDGETLHLDRSSLNASLLDQHAVLVERALAELRVH